MLFFKKKIKLESRKRKAQTPFAINAVSQRSSNHQKET
jgi:hypothetical protein